MKINLSYPATGCQKLIDIADELKVNANMIVVLSTDNLWVLVAFQFVV